MIFERTYTITSGPAGLSFDVYKTRATAEFLTLLDTASDEASVQDFLEKNPCFVPRATAPGSHGPLFDALIARPPLPGIRPKIPDFMWITSNSSEWYPTLIEIESPTKALFRKDGVPTADFTQARNQLAEWRAWFCDPRNVQKFISEYRIPNHFIDYKVMSPRFVLVYGRRREFQGDPVLSKLRAAQMTAPEEELMSFDRLYPERLMSNAVTARANGCGRYTVLSVMPTMGLGPVVADEYLNFEGLDEAIEHDLRISEERRQFMRSRLPYWRQWHAGPRGIVNTGDCE